MTDDIRAQVDALRAKFQARGDKLGGDSAKVVRTACLLVQRYAMTHMTPDGPSSPGEPPAVVTGRLRASITMRVESEDGKPAGYVGTNVEYASSLEYGTSKMAPRPFLVPALEANKPKIRDLFRAAMIGKLEGADA